MSRKPLFVFIFLCLMLFEAKADPSSKTIIIGTLPYNPPFEINYSKTYFFGFDIDIMRSICKHAQLSCMFKTSEFMDLFTEVDNGTIDLAIASIILTKDRQEDYLLSLPYLQSYTQFFTRKNSDINSLKDLHGKIISTVADPLLELYIYKHYADTNTIHKPFYNSLQNGLIDLESGHINVFLLDKASVVYWVNNNSEELKMIGNPIKFGEGYAVLGSKNNSDLMNAVNKALLDMEKDGSYTRIYSTYFEQ